MDQVGMLSKNSTKENSKYSIAMVTFVATYGKMKRER
jgi:hypothetical protein